MEQCKCQSTADIGWGDSVERGAPLLPLTQKGDGRVCPRLGHAWDSKLSVKTQEGYKWHTKI